MKALAEFVLEKFIETVYPPAAEGQKRTAKLSPTAVLFVLCAINLGLTWLNREDTVEIKAEVREMRTALFQRGMAAAPRPTPSAPVAVGFLPSASADQIP